MKPVIVGTLDCRDDADFLPGVLEQARGMKLDAIYAYDDGSQDKTGEVMSQYCDKVWRRNEFDEKELGRFTQHRRGWLLEQVKNDFDYRHQNVWVVRLEGDRLFHNQSAEEIVDRAIKAGHTSRCGVMLDFKRHRLDKPGWDEADLWPDWTIKDAERLMRWFTVDDVHSAVAYKVTDATTHSGQNRPRPWPRGLAPETSDCNRDVLTRDMVWFRHYGRRTPKYYKWVIDSKSRILGRKTNPADVDFTSPETVAATVGRYRQYKHLPWLGDTSIDLAIQLWNSKYLDDAAMMRRFYLGIEIMYYAGLERGIDLLAGQDVDLVQYMKEREE